MGRSTEALAFCATLCRIPTSLKNSTFEPGLLDLEKVYVSARETRTYFI